MPYLVLVFVNESARSVNICVVHLPIPAKYPIYGCLLCLYSSGERREPYIPVVNLLLVPNLLSLGGGGGGLGILQLALPHLVDG
jgi:hypothetical protein